MGSIFSLYPIMTEEEEKELLENTEDNFKPILVTAILYLIGAMVWLAINVFEFFK